MTPTNPPDSHLHRSNVRRWAEHHLVPVGKPFGPGNLKRGSALALLDIADALRDVAGAIRGHAATDERQAGDV